MTRRIEPVETYASLFRWAATYSLLLTDDVLHVVRLGPAMGGVGGAEGYLTGASRQLDAEARRDRLAGNEDLGQETGAALGVALAAPVLERVEARYGAQVAAGVRQLEARGHEALSAEKGSIRFMLSEIQSFGPGKKESTGGHEEIELALVELALFEPEATVEDPYLLMQPWTRATQTGQLNTDPLAEIEEPLPCVERDLQLMFTRERG